MFALARAAPTEQDGGMLKVGQQAPDFSARTTTGSVTLGDLRGRWVVLYFFPKAFTIG